MHTSVYLAVLFTGLFGVAGPVLAGRLPPAVATWLLGVGGLAAAAGSSAALALLGFTLVGQSRLLAVQGQWSGAVLRHDDPVATPVALIALVLLSAVVIRTARAGTRRLAAVREAYRLAASLPSSDGELAVLDAGDAHAFAVPGRPGRIVVTTGLLRSLDAGGRRALLAHERAHLTHRHHVHQSLAHLAAAANPLLGRLPGAVELSCERWADEAAARACPRDTVADALTDAATSTHRRAPAVVLAAAVTDIATRVGALRVAPTRLTLWRVALLVGLVLATVAAVAEAARDTERLFELAQYAYRTGQR